MGPIMLELMLLDTSANISIAIFRDCLSLVVVAVFRVYAHYVFALLLPLLRKVQDLLRLWCPCWPQSHLKTLI